MLEGNNLPLAIDYLKTALQLDPKLGFAHYNLGLARQLQKDWQQAIASFQKAIIYSPNSAEPVYHWGTAIYNKGN